MTTMTPLRSTLVPVLLAGVLAAATLPASVPAAAADVSYGRIARGKYLTDAADCIACHTVEGGKPFAGGRAVPTPFGTIYTPNITPDRDTGIGAWTDEAFYRAMHEGIRPDGSRLYPAFPYPSFTKMPREDVLAIRAYLNTLDPVRSRPPANDLTWPLNHRVFLRGWNLLFFSPGTFEPDPRQSEAWNRGAYLVQGPGHCGACHTGKNALGANSGPALRGGVVQGWWAPSLDDDQRTGLGRWSVADVVEYLKTGRNRFSGATGLMAEVVKYSLSNLTEADLEAIAVYLKAQGPGPGGGSRAADRAVTAAGRQVFADQCAACHATDGSGVPRMFPPLASSTVVQQSDPTTVLRVILEGARTVATDQRPTPSAMPAFAWKLTDAEIAAVATYVRGSFGNRAGAVSAGAVGALRKTLKATGPVAEPPGTSSGTSPKS
ncbi:Putative diheme cytochrome c-553 [Rhodovulum sp. PH10]|nr:Putative diheme cytochrome c-553 [Rhodovulum sp. PH10]